MSERTMHTEVLRKGDAVVGLRRKLLRVTVRKGPDRGLKKDFSEDRLVIGSHPSCEIPLTDPAISRQHCEVRLVDDGYLIRDLGSTNGTFVDRLRVRGVTTARELRVQMGNSELMLTPLSDTVELPLAAADRFGALRGRSPLMRQMFQRLQRFSESDLTVLILGESGTGKELAAQALHDASARAKKPFVVVDCGALSATLIESELFGHLRGAFTGADRTRQGAFSAASGGTLFLDEIGELPLDLQSRLLGALERRQAIPVGGEKPVSFDVRIIAATNRDLRAEVNRGTFREDLFFRLAVAVVNMPPLRRHLEDIPLYVEEFLGDVDRVDEETLTQLQRMTWPGNVRELRNALERTTAMSAGTLLEQDGAEAADRGDAVDRPKVSFAVDAAMPFKTGKALLLEQYERMYLESLMKLHEGNMSAAARAAEIDRVYLVRLLDKFGLRPRR